MSSSDSRRRPSIWSYLSFSQNSQGLPTSGYTADAYGRTWKTTVPDFGPAGRVEHFRSGWMNQSARSRWLRIGGVLFVVICLFFWLSPGDRVSGYAGQKQAEIIAADGTSGQARCTKSYSADKPLKQYVLMIDAGSTGSRIHVYRFNNCGPTPELEMEVFEQTAKKESGGSGLSSYGSDAAGAAQSLDVLMDKALESVPEEYRSCSPVAVKATAGLRLLGDDMSQKILDAVRERLETKYPFPVVSKENEGVVIMDGKYEAIYAWITVNYLLGKIGGPDKTETAAIFDLGGGSTQIVFQPTFKSPSKGMPETMAEGDHKYKLNFGGQTFELYQHSHLGYGLMEARSSLHRFIYDAAMASGNSTLASLENPCFPPGMAKTVEVKLSNDMKEKVSMVGPTSAQPAQCRGLVERLLKKESECKLAPCSFNGVHQPSLAATFSHEDVYIISYFYDRTQPLGMPESFTLKELRDLTAQVCQGKDAWGTFATQPGTMEELDGRPEWCLDLNFMTALLHSGYEMPLDREVRIAKKIKDKELGWCLGASLPLLEHNSGWKCKISKQT